MPESLKNANASSASAPISIGSSTGSSWISPNPAAVRRVVTRSGSASEKGVGASGGGVPSSRPRARAPRMVVSHSLLSSSRHTSSASRPPGRRPLAMLVKAAIGSPKNMAPLSLIATSAAPGSNGCTWASPCTKVTLVTPSAAACSRA